MGLTGMGILPESGWQSRTVVGIRETALPSVKEGQQDPKAGATPAPPRTMATGFFPFFLLHAVVQRIRFRFRFHGECLSPAHLNQKRRRNPWF